MTWIHRPTWPDSGKKDRSILKDGKPVGRVTYIPHGPQGGNWSWGGLWCGRNNRGVTGEFGEALEAVRSEYLNTLNSNPDEIRHMEERSARVQSRAS